MDAEVGGDMGDRAARGEDLAHRPLPELIGVLPGGWHGDGFSLLQALRACLGSLHFSQDGPDVYLAGSVEDAELRIDKAIAGCAADQVSEVRALGRTLARWRGEIRGRHATGASNGPTEGLNLLVKKVKRAGHGFRSFTNYRLRILLHAGGVRRPASRPPTPRIRTRSPH